MDGFWDIWLLKWLLWWKAFAVEGSTEVMAEWTFDGRLLNWLYLLCIDRIWLWVLAMDGYCDGWLLRWIDIAMDGYCDWWILRWMDIIQWLNIVMDGCCDGWTLRWMDVEKDGYGYWMTDGARMNWWCWMLAMVDWLRVWWLEDGLLLEVLKLQRFKLVNCCIWCCLANPNVVEVDSTWIWL